VVALPKALRRLAPDRVRDDARLRAVAVGAGVIPPRTMHSPAEAALLRQLAEGRRRVAEIGVYEGSSAVVLCEVLNPGAELHLIDPFGHHPTALREGAAATEWATKRVVARAARDGGPRVVWHVDFSAAVAERWTLPLDLVFVDGDHSELGVATDWEAWHGFVAEGGSVMFHDARATQPGGGGLPGPTAVVDRLFRGPRAIAHWEITAETDGAVAVTHVPRAA
jgi:predicted O-methyltransferase YrrM